MQTSSGAENGRESVFSTDRGSGGRLFLSDSAAHSIGRGFGIVPMRIPADEIADCRMTAVRYGYVKSSPFGLLRINVTTRLRAVRRLILFLVEEIYPY